MTDKKAAEKAPTLIAYHVAERENAPRMIFASLAFETKAQQSNLTLPKG